MMSTLFGSDSYKDQHHRGGVVGEPWRGDWRRQAINGTVAEVARKLILTYQMGERLLQRDVPHVKLLLLPV